MYTSEVDLACALIQDAFGPFVARVARLLLLYRSLTFLELRDLLPSSSISSSGGRRLPAGAAKSSAAGAQQQQSNDEEYCKLRNALLILVQHNLLQCTPIVPSGIAGAAVAGGAGALFEGASGSGQHQQQTVAPPRGGTGVGINSTISAAEQVSGVASSPAVACTAQPHGGIRYCLLVHAALALLRFPALAAITEETLGTNARLLLLQVFKAGRVCMQDAVALAMADPCQSLADTPVAFALTRQYYCRCSAAAVIALQLPLYFHAAVARYYHQLHCLEPKPPCNLALLLLQPLHSQYCACRSHE